MTQFLLEKFVHIGKSLYFCIAFQRKSPRNEVWRDGRVVDYTGLENRRAERHRGFESLSLRNKR